jgi:hypothetical protein
MRSCCQLGRGILTRRTGSRALPRRPFLRGSYSRHTPAAARAARDPRAPYRHAHQIVSRRSNTPSPATTRQSPWLLHGSGLLKVAARAASRHPQQASKLGEPLAVILGPSAWKRATASRAAEANNQRLPGCRGETRPGGRLPPRARRRFSDSGRARSSRMRGRPGYSRTRRSCAARYVS